MEFVKPSTQIVEHSVVITMKLGQIRVEGCQSHPQDRIIRASLEYEGWSVLPFRGGYCVEGGTDSDRKALMLQLLVAYGVAPAVEGCDDELIGLVTQEIIKGDCRRQNNDEPNFPPTWNPLTSNDGYAVSCAETAKNILALVRGR